MCGFSRHLKLALSVGVLIGTIFGVREGFDVLLANFFVQPGQYFGVYLALPVLSWMVLGSLLSVGVVFCSPRMFRQGPWALQLLVFAVTLAGCLSVTNSWVESIASRMSLVGAELSFVRWLILATASGVIALVAAALVTSAAAYWNDVLIQFIPRVGFAFAIVAVPLCLFPIAFFLASDWKRPGLRETVPLDKPNLLLISIDTLRADHLGSYGSELGLTPHLDALAEQGVVFEQAITSSPWTLPAIASLHTGQLPRRHGAGWPTNSKDPLGRSPVDAGTWTLAQALRNAGYRTTAIVTNPYLALRYGLGAGFDEYENITIESEAFLAFGSTTAGRLIHALLPRLAVGDRGGSVTSRAAAWLAAHATAGPFFLWLHYIDPHPPYALPGITSHKSFRGDSLLASEDAPSLELRSPDIARLRSGELQLTDGERNQIKALYRAEVAEVDAQVGSTIKALDDHNIARQTLVVVVADHGEEFWDHGGVEHGHTVYEELVHIPLFFRWLGRLEPARVKSLASISDVAPTVLALLEVPASISLEGHDLLGAKEDARSFAVSEDLLFAEDRVGLRTESRKYVLWPDGRQEIYNLLLDPKELRNLVADPIESVALQEILRQNYLDTVSIGRRSTKERVPVPDPAALEALRALGYAR